MTPKRMLGIIALSLKKNGFQRAEWLKKHHVFAEMGEDCFWQPRNIPPEAKMIKLHNNVVIASEVLFVNHDVMHHVFRKIEPEYEFPTKYGAVEIGDHVFIGSRCTILPGTKIEDNVIIGAGSLVRGKILRGGVYAGVPAKRIGDFDKVMKSRTEMSRKGKSKAEYFEEFWKEFDKKYGEGNEAMSEQTTVMILGAGQLQVPILQRAKERGYRIIVVSPDADQPGMEYADEEVLLDVRNEAGILAAAEMYKINGITTDQTDLPVRTAAYVADKMGLPSIGYDVGCLFTDKFQQREKSRELGIPSPRYAMTHSLEQAEREMEYIGFPAIIKPIDSQASHGVAKITSIKELRDKYQEAVSYSRMGGGTARRVC